MKTFCVSCICSEWKLELDADFQLVDGAEGGVLRVIRAARLHRTGAGDGRIDIAGIDELAAQAGDVTGLEHGAFPETLLHVEVHVLDIGRTQILVDGEDAQDRHGGAGPGVDAGLEHESGGSAERIDGQGTAGVGIDAGRAAVARPVLAAKNAAAGTS